MLYTKKNYYLITPIFVVISFLIIAPFAKNIFFSAVVAGFIGVILGPRVKSVKTIGGKYKTVSWRFSDKTFKIHN